MARQTWPELIMAAAKIFGATSWTSTSSRMIAASLPPSSRVTRLSAEALDLVVPEIISASSGRTSASAKSARSTTLCGCTGPPAKSREPAPSTSASSGAASSAASSVVRLRTSPRAPSSLCSQISTTVRRKLGSVSAGEAISRRPRSESIRAHIPGRRVLCGLLVLLRIALRRADAQGDAGGEAGAERVEALAGARRGGAEHAPLALAQGGPALAQPGERGAGRIEALARRGGRALGEEGLRGVELEPGVGELLEQIVHPDRDGRRPRGRTPARTYLDSTARLSSSRVVRRR